jgi:hypothetical protein
VPSPAVALLLAEPIREGEGGAVPVSLGQADAVAVRNAVALELLLPREVVDCEPDWEGDGDSEAHAVGVGDGDIEWLPVLQPEAATEGDEEPVGGAAEGVSMSLTDAEGDAEREKEGVPEGGAESEGLGVPSAVGEGALVGETAPLGEDVPVPVLDALAQGEPEGVPPAETLLDAETEALALPMLLIEGGALDVTVEEGVAAPVAENGADGDEDTVGELVPPPAGDGVPMLLSLLVGDAEGAWEEERLPEGLEETLGDRVPDTE